MQAKRQKFEKLLRLVLSKIQSESIIYDEKVNAIHAPINSGHNQQVSLYFNSDYKIDSICLYSLKGKPKSYFLFGSEDFRIRYS
jgi:intergrase/recombinase